MTTALIDQEATHDYAAFTHDCVHAVEESRSVHANTTIGEATLAGKLRH